MKQFVKISKALGFNRNRLLYWEFFEHEDKEETVYLHFESGIVILEGADVRTFRDWSDKESQEAPIAHQATFYGPQGEKRKPTPERGK